MKAFAIVALVLAAVAWGAFCVVIWANGANPAAALFIAAVLLFITAIAAAEA